MRIVYREQSFATTRVIAVVVVLVEVPSKPDLDSCVITHTFHSSSAFIAFIRFYGMVPLLRLWITEKRRH